MADDDVDLLFFLVSSKYSDLANSFGVVRDASDKYVVMKINSNK
jgi:hypothetical protein